MESMINEISNYGVSIVIIGLFLYDWFINKKETRETLSVIKATSENISKSLDLLLKSMENNTAIINKHDEKMSKLLNKE